MKTRSTRTRRRIAAVFASGALVTGNANDGLSVQPLDRRITYRTCRAQEVVAHWAKRGRPRQTSEPLEPSPLQLELDTTIRD